MSTKTDRSCASFILAARRLRFRGRKEADCLKSLAICRLRQSFNEAGTRPNFRHLPAWMWRNARVLDFVDPGRSSVMRFVSGQRRARLDDDGDRPARDAITGRGNPARRRMTTSGAVGDGHDPRLPGAIGAAIEGAVCLDSVADHLASALGADRGELVDRALEAVEDMPLPRRDDFEGQVIFVAADFTLRHDGLLGRGRELGWSLLE